MDKSILRKFAIESRQELMSKIKNKIQTFYIDEDFSKEQKGEVYVLSNEKHSLSLTKEEYQKRELLIKRIKELSLEQVVEESAYTWFNRIIAIRYMEINDMLPLTKDNQSLGIRVLSSKDNTPDPEILKFSNLTNPDLDIELKKEKYIELKTDNEKFKYVLLLVCKKLGKVIPQVFDGVTDYIDILIPDNLLNDTGFITKVIKEVPEENYNQVEIIGWLYQYYNQVEKDRVISAKKTYKKSEIAYATQLFTPDWIVKYMVENTLGRYWIERNEKTNIISNWDYFIDNNIENISEKIDPTKITFIDPCCGSGHILVYAFDILYQIYESVGYNKKDIVELILKYNLYGLDIDDRAGQLSILSILLKAREKDKEIFNKPVVRNLNIMSIQESSKINDLVISNLLDKEAQDNAIYLLDTFSDAKEIGSLQVMEDKDYTVLEKALTDDDTIFGIELREKMLPLIKQANILSKKFDVVVTNPPYMNNSVMSANLKNYIQKNYKAVKSDLFSSFIVRNSLFGNEKSHLGFMTPYVWMFISSYEDLRKYITNNLNISSLIQFEYSAFEEATVPICTFTLKNKSTDENGTYYKLSEFLGGMEVQRTKFLEALNKEVNYKYDVNSGMFKKMPGHQIAFWISEALLNSFSNGEKLCDIAYPRQGMATTNNNKFLRQWFEVEIENIGFGLTDENETIGLKKWFPYNKGGEYRKWYGNNDYVVNFKNKGEEVCNYIDSHSAVNHTGRVINRDKYFKKSVTWSKISSGNIAFRFKENGFIFDVAGTSIFGNDNTLIELMGFLNSKVSLEILNCLSPTLNYEVGHICSIPILKFNNARIKELVEENINISKNEWDSYEVSWNFKKHPLIPNFDGVYDINNGQFENKHCWLSELYNDWEKFTCEQFNKLKQNEEELNKIFIDIYGLANELSPKVNDKDVSIRKADKIRDIKSLISYAVGCMFGRYSLDTDGVVYAGGKFDVNKYKTFMVDNDNVIPITDDSYFSDDIVNRFRKFIEIVYGKETLNDNLDFIAETLGKRGTETSEETIRRYFNNDFYNDHIKIYQKRPIYWLFDSGKKDGFKCLTYIHRYNENLVPKIRLDYLHRMQNTYEKILSDVNYKLTTELSMNDKKEIQRKQAELSGKLQETIEYDEKIAHIANQKINIDLDDGIVVNYDKFKDILEKIK